MKNGPVIPKDVVWLSDLSQECRRGLDLVLQRYNLDNPLQPEQAAWMVFILKATPDDPETFPKGKWATIQILEQLVMDEYSCNNP